MCCEHANGGTILISQIYDEAINNNNYGQIYLTQVNYYYSSDSVMSRNRAPTAATKFGTSKFDIPPPKSEPLPLYPLLETKPAPLDYSDYALSLAATDRSLINIFRKSADYLEFPSKKPKIERYEVKDVSKNDRSRNKNSFQNICGDIDLAFFPEELLPRKSIKSKSKKSKFDRIFNLLDELEVEENKKPKAKKLNPSDLRDVKPSTSALSAQEADEEEEEDEDAEGEVEEGDDEELNEEAEDDEDLEAGGDYIDTYFDNGEGYEDNDDDGDEGPMY